MPAADKFGITPLSMNAGTGQGGSVLEVIELDGEDADRRELNPKPQT